MKETVFEAFTTLWSVIPLSTEFWSAIFGAVVGAVVGGFIAYIIQAKALSEARNQRNEDHKRSQLALGNALLLKMIRIHSNFHNLHRYIEESFEEAASKGLDVEEPWQFVRPLANPPDLVHFSPNELGMLIGLKNDGVFNAVFELDNAHNHQIYTVKVLSIERRALTELLPPGEVDGTVFGAFLDNDQALAVRPRMVEVNSLIKSIRANTKKDYEESGDALDGLNKLLREKLGLAYRTESKLKVEKLPTPENS